MRGPSWKLRRLRETKRCTVLFRVGWEWGSVDGPVDIIGPNDSFEGFDPGGVPQLLRDVFTAAGGTHDDWDEYDRVMAEDERAAVFVHPTRIQGRGLGNLLERLRVSTPCWGASRIRLGESN